MEHGTVVISAHRTKHTLQYWYVFRSLFCWLQTVRNCLFFCWLQYSLRAESVKDYSRESWRTWHRCRHAWHV